MMIARKTPQGNLCWQDHLGIDRALLVQPGERLAITFETDRVGAITVIGTLQRVWGQGLVVLDDEGTKRQMALARIIKVVGGGEEG